MEIIDNLNLEQIAESGQCFRMKKIKRNHYNLIAYDSYLELIQIDKDKIKIISDGEEGEEFWRDYFDCDFNYHEIVNNLKKRDDEFLKKAVEFGSGLRILRQEAFETLISFIISQNKNIPAIKSSIDKLSAKYGEKKQSISCNNTSYFTFPKPEVLADAEISDLRSLGLGYRDEYVKLASIAVVEGRLNLEKMKKLDLSNLMKELMSLKGVGKKVASCVALFGFHRMEVAPVDVWIARINKEIYKGEFPWDEYEGIAGLVQQYLFYYIRNSQEITLK